MYQKYVKRPLDVLLSLCAIILLSPVMLAVAVLIRVKLGSPVIFRQKRPGKGNRLFTLYKFRTMGEQRDKDGRLLPDDARLTQFGKTLRETSLDELPELFNILKGEMSLIGPRPLLVKDIVFFDDEQIKRHSVRPGLSGLAQVNGRNNAPWEERLAYDLVYINNITFLGDVKILLKTVVKTLKREDIVQEGTATSEDFGDYLLRENKIDEESYREKITQCMEWIDAG